MIDRSREFDATALSQRTVERTPLMLGLVGSPIGPYEQHVAVLDASDGEVVDVPGAPRGDSVRPLCLSWDGGHVLLMTPAGDRPDGALCLHELATGKQRWFDARTGAGQDRVAALSPDGRAIATVSTGIGEPGTIQAGGDVATWDVDDDGAVGIYLLDVGTGSRDLLWHERGGWSAETAVSWSPDGRRIAATYFTRVDDEDEWATVVLDAADGSVLGRWLHTAIPACPNGAWLTPDELVAGDELEDQLVLLDLATGGRRVLSPLRAIPHGVVGGRLVASLPRPAGQPLRYVTTHLDGHNQQPFVTLTRGSIIAMDVAPHAQ